jgi:hypothetical protein
MQGGDKNIMKTLFFILIATFSLWGGSFDRAIEFVLAHEGGYCRDGGYESNYGICSQWYPKENMKTMTRERAIEIYKRDYWERTGCDMELDSNYALLIFDTAVLFGQPTAIIMKRGCYDKGIFMEKRIAKTVEIISHDCQKAKHLEGWILRLLDLQEKIK